MDTSCQSDQHPKSLDTQQEPATVAAFVHGDFVGKGSTFAGPYGLRHILYADTAASGRPTRGVEQYLQTEVMPSYGNTHSSASYCGTQTVSYCNEARALIKKAVHASDHDALIFCGSGVSIVTPHHHRNDVAAQAQPAPSTSSSAS